MSEAGTMSLNASTLPRGGRAGGRPEGTKRRQLEWITNFALVVVSLFGISIGSGLIIFYKMDHFSFIGYQFTILPWLLLGGGFYTLCVAGFGLFAVSQRSPALLMVYSCFLFVAFMGLVFSVFLAVSAIIVIEREVEHEVLGHHLEEYRISDMATKEWDLIQSSYRCCGVGIDEYSLGFVSWQMNEELNRKKGVPDSCCIVKTEGCGERIFENYSPKQLGSYAKRIYVHGCMVAITTVLEDQICPLLLVYAIVGALLCMLELLGVVLACALAHVLRRLARQKVLEEARIRQIQQQAKTSAEGGGERAAYTDTSL